MKRVTWQFGRTVFAAGVLVAFSAKGEIIAQVVVPTPVFADTETVAHVALPPMNGKKYFKVSLDFNASPSNCLTVAFGRDVDGDGKLSLREQAVELGWDGAWFIRRNDVAAWERYDLVGTDGRHLFEASKWLYCTRSDQQLTLTADGIPLAFENGTDAWLPLSDLDGGTVRVTSRGTGVEGAAQIIVNADGTVLQLK